MKLADRVDALAKAIEDHKIDCATFKATKPEISQVLWTPKIVMTALGFVAAAGFAVGTGQFLATSGMRESQAKTEQNVAVILTKMSAQTEIDALKVKAQETKEKADEAAASDAKLRQLELAKKVSDMEGQIRDIANAVKSRR